MAWAAADGPKRAGPAIRRGGGGAADGEGEDAGPRGGEDAEVGRRGLEADGHAHGAEVAGVVGAEVGGGGAGADEGHVEAELGAGGVGGGGGLAAGGGRGRGARGGAAGG